MRVVVDTNVVVSAILRDRLPEKVLLFIISQPDFEWVALRSEHWHRRNGSGEFYV
jgi:predicted nucleic acid-binding protein